MAILTLAESQAAAVAAEIKPFEDAINAQLSKSTTQDYLANTEFTEHVVSKEFQGASLSAEGIAGLIASIEAAGWEDVAVENSVQDDFETARGSQKKYAVTVSFSKPAAAPSGSGSGSGSSPTV